MIIANKLKQLLPFVHKSGIDFMEYSINLQHNSFIAKIFCYIRDVFELFEHSISKIVII